MDLEKLVNFFALCQYKSFSQAASKRYLSRQALIRSINSLESELKRPLFSRNTVGVELTDFGRFFYEEASVVKPQLEALCALAETYDKCNSNHIAFGIRGNFGSAYSLRQHLDAFQQSHQDVTVEVVCCESDSMETIVRDGGVDMAFSILPPSLPELESETLLTIELTLLLHRDDPLATAPVITPQLLGDRAFIVTTFSNHTFRIFNSFFADDGIVPDVRFITADMNLMFTAVSRRELIGVTIARDAAIATSLFDDLVCRSFNPPLILEQGLLIRSWNALTPMQKTLVQYLRSNFYGTDYRQPPGSPALPQQ